MVDGTPARVVMAAVAALAPGGRRPSHPAAGGSPDHGRLATAAGDRSPC